MMDFLTLKRNNMENVKRSFHDMTKEEKKKYKKDFPGQGSFNWKKVKLITPEFSYYNNHVTVGVVLHDGKFCINGVIFENFEIIEEKPIK